MKKLFIPVLASAMLLLTGCAIELGSGGSKTISQKPTLGQQLVDLQKAKDAGAINDTEFQAQKAKLLQSN
jgi:outer membrane biogenesis lipoprotein LolB